jgi:DNA-binding beta-propeller fold protein YncE
MNKGTMTAADAKKHLVVAIIVAVLTAAVVSCARTPEAPDDCGQAAVAPVAIVELPGNPFQAIPALDDCHAFVSLVGPVEPGDPRRPPTPGAGAGGVAVVRLAKEPFLERVVTLDGSPYGMVLTHDGRLLIVTSDDRVAFVDSALLIAGSTHPVLGYLHDAPMAGRMYANVTSDDRWLFLSDESARSISVVDLAVARATNFQSASVIGQIPVGRAPIALTFSPDERLLYSTSQVAPDSYGWPADCSPPASELARQGPRHANGAILVIDVARATREPAQSVIAAIPAGCNPVRLVISPDGSVAYVSARTDNTVLAFDTRKFLNQPASALIGRVQVGDAPVGLAVLSAGAQIAVTNSNRFASAVDSQSLAIIDAKKIGTGEHALIGTVPTGLFPRELRLTGNQRTLLLTNSASKTLAVMDVARLPIEGRRQ